MGMMRTPRFLTLFDNLSIDVRHALRRLRRRPVLTLLVVLLFGLGIGLNVGLFSVADAVLLGPLPFDESDDLYALWPARTFNKEMVVRAGEELESWRGVAAYTEWAYPVTSPGGAEQVASALVSTNFFDVLGVAPRRGSFFRSEQSRPGQDGVVVVSSEYWQSQLGGDEAAVGATLRVDGRDRTIVGILPTGSRLLGTPTDLWMPYPVDQRADDYGSSFYLWPVGRLVDGVDPGVAVEELKAFSRRLQSENANYTPHEETWPPTVQPLRQALYGDSSQLLRALSLAALAVLVLVCANASHLLLVHAESRRGELALLSALGAGRFRLARSLVVETLLLALAGGGVGCLVLAWSRGALLLWLPEGLPRRADLALDGRALSVCLSLALVVTCLAVVLPARRTLAHSSDASSSLRRTRSARGLGVLQKWFVTLQVAAVVTLVMTAVLLGRSLEKLGSVDLGLQAEGAVTLRVHPPAEDLALAERGNVFGSIFDEIARVPGVRAAGGIQLLPLAGDGNWSFPYLAEGQAIPEGPLPVANFRVVTPGYAGAAGLPILQGRDFDARDHGDSQPVGWINRTLAEQLWPGETAVGRVIKLFGNQPFTVVGVVGDVRQLGLRRAPDPAMYRPLNQYPVSSLHLVVRTVGDPLEATPSIRSAVAAAAPGVAVSDVRPMEAVLKRSVDEPRFVAHLVGGFAALAFFLGLCGILAVLGQVVESRRREIGVRLALGAEGRRIEAEVLRSSLGQAAWGVALGTVLALATGWWLRSQLFGVEAWDPVALGTAAVGALAAVALGSWWPARRAARVDPAQALRSE